MDIHSSWDNFKCPQCGKSTILNDCFNVVFCESCGWKQRHVDFSVDWESNISRHELREETMPILWLGNDGTGAAMPFEGYKTLEEAIASLNERLKYHEMADGARVFEYQGLYYCYVFRFICWDIPAGAQHIAHCTLYHPTIAGKTETDWTWGDWQIGEWEYIPRHTDWQKRKMTEKISRNKQQTT